MGIKSLESKALYAVDGVLEVQNPVVSVEVGQKVEL